MCIFLFIILAKESYQLAFTSLPVLTQLLQIHYMLTNNFQFLNKETFRLLYDVCIKSETCPECTLIIYLALN